MKKRGDSERENQENKKFRKNIFLLGGSSFFNDVGSDMLTAIIPFYVIGLGGTGAAVGLISGLREGLASILKFFGGWLSDRTGKRKIFVFLGYVASIIFRFMLFFVNSWQYVTGFISLERIGKMRDAPRDAIISQSVRKKGRAFGIHQMMDTAGGILGILLVIFLFWKLGLDIKIIILVAGGLSAFSLVPLFFVKEPKTRPESNGIFKSIHLLNRHLKYFVFVSSVFTLANFGLYLFLILRAKELSGGVLLPLVLYAIFDFVYAVFSPVFGKLSDKIGRKKVLLSGYILFFALCIGFIYVTNLFYFSVLFSLYGLVYALTQGNQRAFVSDMSGKMKATAFGFFSSVTGVVNIAGGLIAGLLWDVSYLTMFIYLSAVSFLSIIFLVFVREKRYR